jgi:hypothetical protein
MSDFRTSSKVAQVPPGTNGAPLNGHNTNKPTFTRTATEPKRPAKSQAKPKRGADPNYSGKLIDPLEAQRGALRHVLTFGDVNKCALLKNNFGPENFTNSSARAIAEVLYEQYEAGAAIDFADVSKVLQERGQSEAFGELFALMPTPEREPEFLDCLHTVKNINSRALAPAFETFTFRDLKALPRPQWLIRSLLVEKTTSVISADSGHFKSFIALEMALCVATGTPFHGHEVKRGAAVYVAAEGFYTVYERAAAWAQEQGCELPANFHILKVPVNVSNAVALHLFADCVRSFAPALVVLDTLSQCAVGLNENANNEMADFMRGMMQLSDSIGAHVQAVHHNAKGTGTYRGAGAIKANTDTHITLERPENDEQNTVFVRCEKQRGRPFEAFGLRGREVTLPDVDEFGEPVTSLVFEPCGDVAIAKVKHPSSTRADKTRLALLEVFDRVALEAAEFGGVKVGFWKEAVEEADPPICSAASFWTYRKKLEQEGAIEECGAHNGSPIFKRAASTPSTPSTPICSSWSEPKPASEEYSKYSNNPLGVGVLGVPLTEGRKSEAALPEMPEVEMAKPAGRKSKKARAEFDAGAAYGRD